MVTLIRANIVNYGITRSGRVTARDAMGLALPVPRAYMVPTKEENKLKPAPLPRRLISSAEVDNRVPYSRTHRWRLEQRDEFPKRVTIGQNRVAWWEDEIGQWIADRIRAGRKIASPRKAPAAESR